MSNANSPLFFKYLALPNGIGGRGGAQRFFLLSQNIPFDEQLVPMSEWGLEKERLVTSGENPSGTVPVLYVKTAGSDKTLVSPQHIAASRYLARLHNVSSGDAYQDYVQDMVADEYQGFRDQWVQVTFSGSDEEKVEYREKDLPKLLTKFNALYDKFKTHETYLSVSKTTEQPLWGDAAMFGLLRDHLITGHLGDDGLNAYPHLSALLEAYEAIPAVNAWIEQKKQQLTAAN